MDEFNFRHKRKLPLTPLCLKIPSNEGEKYSFLYQSMSVNVLVRQSANVSVAEGRRQEWIVLHRRVQSFAYRPSLRRNDKLRLRDFYYKSLLISLYNGRNQIPLFPPFTKGENTPSFIKRKVGSPVGLRPRGWIYI